MACLQRGRNVCDLDDGAPLLAELADQRALGAEDAQRNLWVVFGQRLERGQRRIDDSGGIADQQQRRDKQQCPRANSG